MQAQIDKTRGHQHSMFPRILKEPGKGGTATITDNRPSTIYQRKLRKTMHAQTAQKTTSIQRKAPKGSFRFQQIAATMGEMHGVDTSGLVATHNSSFPAKLNAEATIQGHKIHFARGMDTDYNMRHEVAHAIDNTLNGIPKGDRVVNGQKIDTTREQIVDRMARTPFSGEKSGWGKRIATPGIGKEEVGQRSSAQVGNSPTRTTDRPKTGLATAPLQLRGERDAVKSTRDTTLLGGKGIRRGNRRFSLKDTGGMSGAKLFGNPFRDANVAWREKTTIASYTNYVRERMVSSGKYTKDAAETYLSANALYTQALLSRLTATGNCAEFSKVIYTHLVEHTEGQFIYRVMMYHPEKNWDHALVLTSDHDIGAIDSGKTDVTGLDPATTTVADGWHGYRVMLLRDFYNEQNAYSALLTAKNLRIMDKTQATGMQTLDTDVVTYFTAWANDFNKRWAENIAVPGSEENKAAKAWFQPGPQKFVFNTAGSNVNGIDDRRPFEEQWGNTTHTEKLAILRGLGEKGRSGKSTSISRWFMGNHPNAQKLLVTLLPSDVIKMLLLASAAEHDSGNPTTIISIDDIIKAMDVAKAKALLLSLSDTDFKRVGSKMGADARAHLKGGE